MGLGGSFFGGSGDILIKVGADVTGAVRGLGDVKGALAETQTTGQKVQAGIQSAAVPAAAALTGLAAAGLACAKSAATAQESQAKLDDQIRRSTGSAQFAIDANTEWVASLSAATAVSKGELNPAMATLVRSTKNVTEAQQLLVLSTDLAAATGKDLASVSTALAKAHAGSYGSLKRLVPSISEAAIKSKDWAAIQKQLNDQVGGAAKKAAQGTEGQYKMLALQMKGLQVSIGMVLLPTFLALIQVMTPILSLAKEHASLFAYLGVAVAGVAASILALNAIMAVSTAVTTVYGYAQATLAGETIIATAAQKAMKIGEIAWIAVTKTARAMSLAWAAAQWILNAALTANPVGIVVVAVVALGVALVVAYRHSQTFRNIVAQAFQIVRQYGVLMLGPIGLYIKLIQLAWQHSATFREIATAAFKAVEDAIQAVISAISGVVGAIGRIHFPSKPGWIPFSAPGGYSVPSPFLAGGPAALSTGTGGMVVNVSVSGAVDPEATAIQIRRILERYDRRRGRRPLGGELGP